MSTKTICDYPECERTAAWKVELTDLAGSSWNIGSSLSWSYTDSSKRTTLDVCKKHLTRVTFDPDEIAEFQKGAKAA